MPCCLMPNFASVVKQLLVTFIKFLIIMNSFTRIGLRSRFLLVLMIGLILPTLSVWGQNATITGKVVDPKGEPLVGVSVLEQGTTNGTVTDMNGRYSIVVQKDSSPLRFSYMGFDNQEIVERSCEIGTYDTSVLPYEDCCTIFVAKHPVTKPNLNVIRKSEEKLAEKIDELMEAAEKLAAEGISAEVINIHTIKPLDKELIINSAKKTGKVVTAEEHSVIGGLGSAVCEALSEECPTKVCRIGIQDVFGESGPAAALIEKYGLDAKGVCKSVKEFIGK